MRRSVRFSGVAVLALFAGAAETRAVLAQGQDRGAMQVGATVAPRCTVSIDVTEVTDDRSPSVRVVCSRSGLRNLRVSSSRGDTVQPTATFVGAQRQAGGELVFVVPVVLATVASNLPIITVPAQPDRRPFTVTLDF